MTKQRLQKILSAAGVNSRKKCEELILSGVVRVNRTVVDTLPVFADPELDVITVNGKKVRPERKVYFLLNKSKGTICTNHDPLGRRKAVDILNSRHRIFCVGRLDIDTTGLIILTNDSELSNKLTHPRYELPKTYVVTVKGCITGKQIERLKRGVWLAESRTKRASVKILRRKYKESVVEITISQGMNRQVRRMLAKVGLNVKSLKRTKIGRINAKGLGVGKFRQLTQKEVEYLQKTTSLKSKGH